MHMADLRRGAFPLLALHGLPPRRATASRPRLARHVLPAAALHALVAAVFLIAAPRGTEAPAAGGDEAVEIVFDAAALSPAPASDAPLEAPAIPAPPEPILEAAEPPPPPAAPPMPAAPPAPPTPEPLHVAQAPPPAPPPPPPEPDAIAEVPPPPPAPPAPVSEPAAPFASAEPQPSLPVPTAPAAPSAPDPKPVVEPARQVSRPPTARPATKPASRPSAAPAANTAPASPAPAQVNPAPSTDEGPLLITQPRFRSPPTPPVYPRGARDQGQEGEVLVRARLDLAGNPEEVTIERSSGFDLLDRAALAAVRRWAFEPGRRGNRTVLSWVNIPVRFSLR